MSSLDPHQIWTESVEEGRRRLGRSRTGLLATGVVGGVDVMLGITALTVTAGAMAAVMPAETAHLVGSLTFGIGFAFLLVGRSELFTENFLVPIIALRRGKGDGPRLARLWFWTLLGNLGGLLLLSLILSRVGVLEANALDAAGAMAETFADRSVGIALISAVVAGTVMTLMTWLAHAASSDFGRIAIGLLVGFLLAAPSLNHAVVSFGEMALGILAGTGSATWGELALNLPIAVLGNLVGGLGFVTVTRMVQVQGEPG